jgi:hypothetical protein
MADALADKIALTNEEADKKQWDAFRQLSIQPGGFREKRVEIWYVSEAILVVFIAQDVR